MIIERLIIERLIIERLITKRLTPRYFLIPSDAHRTLERFLGDCGINRPALITCAVTCIYLELMPLSLRVVVTKISTMGFLVLIPM